jgi:hypothetical protein
VIYKRVEDIEANDLQGLCDQRVREGTQLDFKDDLPSNDDKSKVDFLHDVTALANTNGGDLIYGIIEERESDGTKTGIAAKASGIENLNVDDRKLWMLNLIRDNTEPRLIGVDIYPVVIDATHTALIVRVPRSWNAPHAVKFGKHWRFYARHSAGNYPMDVTQLRDSFLMSSTVADKLVAFRDKRIETIKAAQSFRPYGALLVIHLQPFESVRADANFDLRNISSENFLSGRYYEGHPTIRINFDGKMTDFKIDGEQRGYVQVYRSGITEELDSDVLNNEDRHGTKYIDATELERVILRGVGGRLALLKEIGVTSPVMLHISLLRVGDLVFKGRIGKKLPGREYYLPGERALPYPADRDDLLLKGHVIENLQDLALSGRVANNDEVHQSWKTAEKIVQPLLDMIWNAFGEEKCLHYNQSGDWMGVDLK